MLDSHRLAPYPELTFQFFGGGVGVGQGQEWEMRRRGSTQNWTERDRLTLAQKQHSRPRERVGAGSSRPPSDPPCPLGRAQTSKWSLPNLFRGQEGGEGAALPRETEQGRGEAIRMETFRGERAEHDDRG